MPQKIFVIDEDELKDIRSQVVSVEAFLKNGQDINEIQKRLNILNYLIDKIEQTHNVCRTVAHVFIDSTCANCGKGNNNGK